MRTISQVIATIGFTLFTSSSAVAAPWMCNGNCDTIANGVREMRGTGPSRQAAHDDLELQCRGWTPPDSVFLSEITGPVDCRELTPPTPTYQLILMNDCPLPGVISTAVGFRDLNGQWITNGFWNLGYRETAAVGQTTNLIFYTHGRAGDRVWGDSNNMMTVSDRNLPFTRQTIEEGTPAGNYTLRYTCN